MSPAILLFNLVLLACWLWATRFLLRRFGRPGVDRSGRGNVPWIASRRPILVLALCFGAGVGGFWGPVLHRKTEVRLHPTSSGPVATERTWRLRTPLVVAEGRWEKDQKGDTVGEVRTSTYQLPLSLILLLLGAAWAGLRTRLVPVNGILSLGLVGIVASCSETKDASVKRPDRQLWEVTWDTVLVKESLPHDTTFYEATRVAADAHGIRVLDRLGHRLAMMSWDGALLWYAGRAGAGPGELAHPREVKLDGKGTAWVLDVGNHRITGFDLGGRRVGEVSLHTVDFVPHQFVVSPGGESFFLIRAGGGLQPVEVRGDGSVKLGKWIRRPVWKDMPPLALQVETAAEEHGDGWVVALSMADGWLRFRGLALVGEVLPWVEEVPLVRVEVKVEGSPGVGEYSRSQRVLDPVFAAQGMAVMGSRVLVLFGGRSEHRGRLLDVYDLDDGSYRGTLLLPVTGFLAAWDGRLVVARNTPHPRVLVLRPSRWP